MGRMTIKSWPDDKREHVVIQIEEDEKPLAHIFLDSATLETHIHDLAKHRALLKDEVPRDLDPGSRLATVVDPVWRIPGQHPPGLKVVVLRHSGFGWLSFALPHSEVRAIAESLTKDLLPPSQ
jgi:hypothetical protein